VWPKAEVATTYDPLRVLKTKHHGHRRCATAVATTYDPLRVLKLCAHATPLVGNCVATTYDPLRVLKLIPIVFMPEPSLLQPPTTH
jgi:hypothetical protein